MARTTGKETWVHPPVVAAELPSKKAALWRYRIVSLLLLLAIAVIVVLLFLKYSNVTGGEGGGIGIKLPAPTQVTGER